MAANNIKTEPVKTVLTITIGFLIVHFATKMQWPLIVATSIGILGLASSFLAEKIDFLWMKLAHILGMIVPNILLTIVFYVFLFPISLLSKVFGKKDPLFLKNPKDSVFTEVNKTFDASSFENPW